MLQRTITAAGSDCMLLNSLVSYPNLMILESYKIVGILFPNKINFTNFGQVFSEIWAKIARWSKLELKVNFGVVYFRA